MRNRIRAIVSAAFAALLITLAIGSPARPIDAGVVRITFKNGGSGSGVAITPRLVLTAGHVAVEAYNGMSGPKDTPKRAQIQSPYGIKQSADVLWSNIPFDVAVVMTDNPVPNPRELACRPVVLGEPVTVIGYPQIAGSFIPQGPIVTRGIVSSNVQYGGSKWLEFVLIDAAVSPGNSGGPVFDASGKLIGIAVGLFGTEVPTGPGDDDEDVFVPAGYSIMIPATTLCRFLGRS